MKKGRLIIFLAVLVCVSMIFAACNKDETKDSVAATENTKETQNADETAGSELSNFNPTGLPVVNERITLKAIARKDTDVKDFEEMELVKKWVSDTNVAVEFETFEPSVWKEKISLILVGGDLPDVFFGQISSSEELTYADQGYFVPLQDLIQDYTVHLKAFSEKNPGVYSSMFTPDGNIYSLPRMKGQAGMEYPHRWYINNDWLSTLGLSAPDTLEEFENVMDAFKTQDPNGNGEADEIPFAFRYNPDMSDRFNTGEYRNGLYGFFGTFGRIDDPDHVVLEDGKTLFTADKQEYKDAIIWMRKAYENGWIDPEAFTMDATTYKAKNTANDTIYGVWNGWTVTEVNMDADAGIITYSYLEPLTNVNGDKIWPKFGYNVAGSGYFLITKENQYPEATIRWIDYFCDPYVSLQHDWGIEGLGTEINDDGTWKVIGEGSIENRQAEGMHWQGPTNVTKDIYDLCQLEGVKKFEDEAGLYYEQYKVDMYPSVYYTLDESQEMAQLSTDICSYVALNTAKWITEGGVEEEWDSYIETLGKLGLERYMEIKSTAIGRTN